MAIRELGFLDDIYKLGAAYRKHSGAPPFDLSHWDATREAQEDVLSRLCIDWVGDFLGYSYPYDINETSRIKAGLGYGTREIGCSFVPNGTIGLSLAIRLLISAGCRRLTVTSPGYFPVFHTARWYGMDVRQLQLCWKDGQFRFPTRIDGLLGKGEALWVTHPVYSTAQTFTSEDKTVLRTMSEAGLPIVLDECLCPQGEALGPELSTADNLIALHSPHKPLLINGTKFCAVLFPRRLQDECDQLVDVVSGGLPFSSVVAMRHFMSENFREVTQGTTRMLERSFQLARAIVDDYHGLLMDPEPRGPFAALYAPSVSAAHGNDLSFLEDLVSQTGTILIPGSRSGFPNSCGFSFRTNLGRLDNQGISALKRCCLYLSDRGPVSEGGGGTSPP